jgi:hypothetical protein
MVKEFDARLQKGTNVGAWTCVAIDDLPEAIGKAAGDTVRIRIDERIG